MPSDAALRRRRDRAVATIGRPTPGGAAALQIAVLLALWAALMPLTQVISPGPWLGEAVAVTGLSALVAWGARAARLPAAVASGAAILVWGVFLTAVHLGHTLVGGFLPTADTAGAIADAVSLAVIELRDGIAPVNPGPSLVLVMVGAVGLVSIVLDHIVVTARLALLAVVLLVPLFLIGPLAVRLQTGAGAYALFGGALLLMLAAETRTRRRIDSPGIEEVARRTHGGAASPPPRRTRTAWVSTAMVGAASVVAALLIAPSVALGNGSGAPAAGGGASRVSQTLELGNDLRRPAEVEVMRVWGDSSRAPYLRLMTMSRLTDDGWEADRGGGRALDQGFPLVRADDIEVLEQSLTVEVRDYGSPWLPIPYRAQGFENVSGEWMALPESQTAFSPSDSPRGQRYTVTYDVAQPTLEQIRALTSAGSGPDPAFSTALPPHPAIPEIQRIAREVTAGADSDYDRLVALQSWFRGAEFTYTLETPVEEGFDGSNIDAVMAFLDVKAGYCVHYAAAFTVMARTLGMPARVVVGYLPGVATGQRVDGQAVQTIQSGRLHAWSEVHFEGVGWVAFEPTRGLGVPTGFRSENPADGTGADVPPEEDLPEPSEPAPTTAPDVDAETDAADGTSVGNASSGGVLTLLALLGIIALACVPFFWRLALRRRRLAAAQRGDALAAWREACASAMDVGAELPPGESARMHGARLTSSGAPPTAVDQLVRAIEYASYAPLGAESDAVAPLAELEGAVTDVRRGLREHRTRGARVRDALLPRSLWRTPGADAAVAAG